jgi:hypothetical protein
MLGIGGSEYLGSPGPHQLGAAVVDIGGGVEADAGMAVLVVVPAEEPAAEGVRVLEAHLTIVFAALAVTRFVENATGWSIKRFVRTARRYRTVQIRVGAHTLTAEDPLPPDLRDALAQIN